MNSKVIVALDYADEQNALELVDGLDPKQCALKVGNEMFTGFGHTFVKELIRRDFKVFLDLKYHDIPNTVASACRMAAELGVWMVNMHASGGLAMMQAAREAVGAYGQGKPLLIAVTVLTSMQQSQLAEIGVHDTIDAQAQRLALLAREAALDGVVCSALEVPSIKAACGQDFLTVTPGIRLAEDNKNDQVRVVTPPEAVALGSDYLVIGRSITRASSPAQKVIEILKSL